MATLDDVNAKLDELAASENTAHADVAKAFVDLLAAIATLKTQGGATPAELDGIIAKAQPVVDALKALDDAAKAADASGTS